jgi:hypothetical protein
MFAMTKKVGVVAKRAAVRAAAGAAAGLASVAAFAQTSGSGVTPAFDDTPILTSINGVAPIIIDIGGAVLAVVVVAWGYKTVKSFLGR